MRTQLTWTIGRKLMLSFLLISAITALSSGVGYYAVSTGAKSIDDLGTVRLPSVDSLLTIKESQQNITQGQHVFMKVFGQSWWNGERFRFKVNMPPGEGESFSTSQTC